MFFEVDTKDVVDYNPQLEWIELDEFQLPRWAYTSEEWAHLVIRRVKLRSLIEEEEHSRKKELSYNMVYLENDIESIFGE